MRSKWLLLSFFLLLPLFSVWGQDAAPGATQALVSSFPGVGEVVPRSAKLAEEGAQARVQISQLSNAGGFKDQIEQAQVRGEALNEEILRVGDPTSWNFDRLVETKNNLVLQQGELNKLLEAISTRLSQLETLRLKWTDKKTFWEGWQKDLKGKEADYPKDIFKKVDVGIGELLKSQSDATAPLVNLQKEVTKILEKRMEATAQLDSILGSLRRATFKKTARSFFNPDYYRQYNRDLFDATVTGLKSVRMVKLDFLQDQWWVVALQLAIILFLGGLILHHRRTVEISAPEWEFMLQHPWATGIFVSITICGYGYKSPPEMWSLILWVMAAFPACILIAALVKKKSKSIMIFVLATFYVLLQMLELVRLPLPLYRMFLALGSLSWCFLLLTCLWIGTHRDKVKKDYFPLAYKVGAGVFFVSFVAQAGGYSTLSFRLIDSSIRTVFYCLFAMMLIRLGQGGVDFLLTLNWTQRWLFLRRIGRELAVRLKALIKISLVVSTGLSLLSVWNIYDSFAHAWSALMAVSIGYGETELTVGVLLWAILLFYLSIQISWLVRSFLDAEVFPTRSMDRGVQDAIKKLLHYTLIFLGVLFAMNVAGFDLKNFAVLAGAFGIGIGFGLQAIVNNFLSGIILLFERPIKVGDTVVLDGDWGTVRKIGLRSTVIETLDEAEVIVPNSMLISEKVTNWTLSNTMSRVGLPVGVAYGSDIPTVMGILFEAARQHVDVLDEPPPSPIFTGFGESSLDFELRVWVSDVTKRLHVKSQLGQVINNRFVEAGIEIPFPQRDLHLRSVSPVVMQSMGYVSPERPKKPEAIVPAPAEADKVAGGETSELPDLDGDSDG